MNACLLASLNVGHLQPLTYRGKSLRSGIFKVGTSGSLRLEKTGLEGDSQGDLKNHGGPDKAVCVYPLEHYPHWNNLFARVLEPGAFGENFSTNGLLERTVCIGDVYRVGSSIVQVSQPRQPCSKLAAKHGFPKLASWAQETGMTGFYFRCVESGGVAAGDSIALIERPAPAVSVAEANRVMHCDRHDIAGIERLLTVVELSSSWRRTLEKRLANTGS